MEKYTDIELETFIQESKHSKEDIAKHESPGVEYCMQYPLSYLRESLATEECLSQL